MQKLVFFIDSNDLSSKAYGSALTIGNLYMNRFVINEDAGHEIVKIYEFEDILQRNPGHEWSVDEKKLKGMGHNIYKCFVITG